MYANFLVLKTNLLGVFDLLRFYNVYSKFKECLMLFCLSQKTAYFY